MCLRPCCRSAAAGWRRTCSGHDRLIRRSPQRPWRPVACRPAAGPSPRFRETLDWTVPEASARYQAVDALVRRRLPPGPPGGSAVPVNGRVVYECQSGHDGQKNGHTGRTALSLAATVARRGCRNGVGNDCQCRGSNDRDPPWHGLRTSVRAFRMRSLDTCSGTEETFIMKARVWWNLPRSLKAAEAGCRVPGDPRMRVTSRRLPSAAARRATRRPWPRPHPGPPKRLQRTT